jgi:hypothetical protein
LPDRRIELWDAFEEKLLANCTDEPTVSSGVFCTVQDKEHFPRLRLLPVIHQRPDDEMTLSVALAGAAQPSFAADGGRRNDGAASAETLRLVSRADAASLI